jgi:hypothetical protein
MTAAKFQSTCPGQQPGPGQAFCTSFEMAARDSLANLANTLMLSGNQYTYYGRFNFFGVNEQAPILPASVPDYAYPSDALQGTPCITYEV